MAYNNSFNERKRFQRKLNLFKVDTTLLYRDFSELEKFKDYQGADRGGTLVGYNYIASYAQHSIDKAKYVIAFEEALVFDEKSKFKLFDNVYCTIDSNQTLATRNCRYNDAYDKEIVAIYTPNQGEEANIVKAWRFNKLTLKIEEVDIGKVKYKEADKNLSLWDE